MAAAVLMEDKCRIDAWQGTSTASYNSASILVSDVEEEEEDEDEDDDQEEEDQENTTESSVAGL